MADLSVASWIEEAATNLGYGSLKEEQKEAVAQFVAGRDVFVALPHTPGYDKSIDNIYLRRSLNGLDERPGRRLFIQGVYIAYVCDEPGSSRDMKQGVLEGRYQLVFMSPESLFTRRKWRKMLTQEPYRTNLVAFVIDEAHCIKNWGDIFRMELARLGEIRSILPSGVNVMTLTATATTTLRTTIVKMLSMKQPAVVSVSPDRSNIKYVVSPFQNIEESFAPIATKLAKETVHMGRMIIFCPKLEDCATLYLFFKHQLGKSFVYPSGAPDLCRFRLVDMYTSCTDASVRNRIIQSIASAILHHLG